MRFFALSFALLAACTPLPPDKPTTPGQKSATEDPNSGTVECHDETPTGSNISHQVCREKEGAHDQRNQDTMTRQLETPKNAPGVRGN